MELLLLIIQYGTVIRCILGIMEVWDFLPKDFTQKPASLFLHDSLAVLVTLGMTKPKNVLRPTNPKPFHETFI